jgi:hypothetical protein
VDLFLLKDNSRAPTPLPVSSKHGGFTEFSISTYFEQNMPAQTQRAQWGVHKNNPREDARPDLRWKGRRRSGGVQIYEPHEAIIPGLECGLWKGVASTEQDWRGHRE